MEKEEQKNVSKPKTTAKKASSTTNKKTSTTTKKTTSDAKTTSKVKASTTAKESTKVKKEKVEEPEVKEVKEVSSKEIETKEEVKEEIKEEATPTETPKKGKLPLWSKITIGVVGGIIGAFCLTVGGLNAVKFAVYKEYYNAEETLCRIPGLNDGFIPQAICENANYNSESQYVDSQYILAGYMKDNSASRFYVTDVNNNSKYVTLVNADDTPWTGHAGGICIFGNYVLTANSDEENVGIYAVNLTNLLQAENGQSLIATRIATPNNYASSLFSVGNKVYVGEFHKDGSKYICSHDYETETEGTHHAIVSVYEQKDKDTILTMFDKPTQVISIRDMVQGFAVLPDERIVLSTSWALKNSHYYVYPKTALRETTKTLDDAPVYILEGAEKDIKGPAMAEGLDVDHEGKIITVSESASKKYNFGKLFNAINCNKLSF